MMDQGFYIGETHQICQDYVLSNINPLGSDMALSDGCSGSILSDYGSRLICSSAISLMKEIGDINKFDEKECILKTKIASSILNLPQSCLDATLIISKDTMQGVQSKMFGDGVIAVKRKNGDICIISISYKSEIDNHEYPFYLSYLCDNESYERWKNSDLQKTTTIDLLKPSGEIINIGGASNQVLSSAPFKDSSFCVKSDATSTIMFSPAEDTDFVAIMSDGVGSFYQGFNSLSIPKVLKELLDFKNYHGSFVQRRLNKFKKFCIQNDWHNMDDVSIGVIYIGD